MLTRQYWEHRASSAQGRPQEPGVRVALGLGGGVPQLSCSSLAVTAHGLSVEESLL